MYQILIADPDSVFLDRCEELLSSEGHIVLSYQTGDELLVGIDEFSADLLVVSIDLEDIPGAVLCRCLRQHPTHGHLPILVIANDCNENAILECLDIGANDYVSKPISDRDLITRISITQKRLLSSEDSKTSSESQLFAGTYEIIDDLGTGGYSTVHRAIDRRSVDGTAVAIKLFESDAYRQINSSFNSFFLREAYQMSKLNHPNIVKFLDFGKFDHSYYMVMEFIDGRPLDRMIKNSGPLSEESILSIAYQCALAFEYLEEHNMVHRDIKPGNIVIDSGGNVKLTDFGLAKQQNDMSLTNVHAKFMGTPHFVAPEQITTEADADIDIRCDIYSLGATLYYGATTMLPFTGETIMEILEQNLTIEPEPVRNINPDISHEFADVIKKMLAKNPDERFQAGELKDRLTAMRQP